jgi:hypothetical protein
MEVRTKTTTKPAPPELGRAVEVLTTEFSGIFGPETVREPLVAGTAPTATIDPWCSRLSPSEVSMPATRLPQAVDPRGR